MKKILVFGSNGLVGNSLKRQLTHRSHEFNILFSTREDTNLFSFEETLNTISEFKPDIVINAAAKVGGIYTNNLNRSEFLIENLRINLNILESLKNYPKTFIINLGSSCIYPLNAENPIKESSIMDGKLEPTNSPYAMAKLTSIELAESLKIQFGHRVLSLMPTNLYGPNDNFSEMNSHVIPGLIARMNRAKLDKDPTFSIWGTGQPKREFLFVDDLADAILFLIDNETSETLLNVGSGFEVTISELAEVIKNTLEYEGELVFDSKMPDGNPRKLLDSSILNNLGWKAFTRLDKGIKNTYDWYLANID
jgi:GDP-L-fucose synthase